MTEVRGSARLGPRLEVWRESANAWRWRYRLDAEESILSNRAFATRDAAVRSAVRAYPGMPIDGPVAPAPRPRAARRRWLIPAALGVGVVGVLLVAVLAARSRTRSSRRTYRGRASSVGNLRVDTTA